MRRDRFASGGEEMEVVVHQGVGVEDAAIGLKIVGQLSEEAVVVRVGEEHARAPVATRSDTVEPVSPINARRARHCYSCSSARYGNYDSTRSDHVKRILLILCKGSGNPTQTYLKFQILKSQMGHLHIQQG